MTCNHPLGLKAVKDYGVSMQWACTLCGFWQEWIKQEGQEVGDIFDGKGGGYGRKTREQKQGPPNA